MPSIRDQSTVEAIAKEFCSNGRCQEKAMITIGYTKAYANSYCGKMWDNPRIKAAIAKIDAETAEKLDLSRDAQHKKLKDTYDLAKELNKPAAMAGAIREQNEMLGYHRENAPNTEKEQAKLELMSAQELSFRKAWEAEQLKGAKTVPIRTVKGA